MRELHELARLETDENLVESDKFWITDDFRACHQRQASNFLPVTFLKIPEIDR